MSKLSLTHRFLSACSPSSDQLDGPAVQTAINKVSTHVPAPAVPQDCSPLSGWSDGSGGGGAVNCQEDQAQLEYDHGVADDVGGGDMFLDDSADHLLSDFYEENENKDDIHSELEEEMEDEDAEEAEQNREGPREDGDQDETIDLGQSPEPSSANRTEVEEHPQQCICQVCGDDLSSWHYLQQVRHVKRCLGRRHLLGGHGYKNTMSNINTGTAPGAGKESGPANVNGRRLLDMDIRTWLKELELDAFIDKFIAEEIDMDIVHVLTEEDLRGIGIEDLLIQRRFMSAARKVGKEISAAKKALRAAEKKRAASVNQHGAPKPKKQQTLQAVGCGTVVGGKVPQRNGTAGGGGIGSGAAAGGNSNGSESAKIAEHALLTTLYPSSRSRNAGAGMRHSIEADGVTEEVQPTPPLAPTTALASSRVAPEASLFTSAARCKQVTESLETRLEKRRAQKPEGASFEPLARGGVQFNKVEESRALKAMKLQALKDELHTHEATVTELRRLIGELEAELGVDKTL